MNVMLRRPAPLNTLDAEKAVLASIRDGVSDIYHEMSGFIVKTTEQMGVFRGMIAPYVRYFYPADADTSTDCFLADVVAPSRRELDGAIDAAVTIMTGDEKMNERVSAAIEDALGLTESIDTVLHLIDEIDVYSENMLIISSKYGEEGMSLARISSEVGAMAEHVNGIGAKFRDFLANLEVYRGEFGEIRRRIEVISENYLTSMKLNLSMVFGEMVRELGGVSNSVHDMLSRSDKVERSMREFMNNIQMEDVVRQKIDRVILFLDDSVYGGIAEDGDMAAEVGPVAILVASRMIRELEALLADQYEEAEGFCSGISSILGDMMARLYDGDRTDAEREQNRMDMIYRRIEDLKNEYIGHMEEIISGKKNLLGLCESFIIILNEFEGLFRGIEATVKRFEALNMITRIELARHARLSRSLGGALNSIMSLPAQMKRIIERSLGLYHGIQNNIVGAVEQYAGNFRLQEEVLDGCIESMKKVSVKLYESQKYYWDISQEVGRSCDRALEFISGQYAKNGLRDASESLGGIADAVRSHLETNFGDRMPDTEAFLKLASGAAWRGQAGPILDALGSELGSDRSREQVIIF